MKQHLLSALLLLLGAAALAQASGNYNYSQQVNAWKQQAAPNHQQPQAAQAKLAESGNVIMFEVRALKNVPADSQMAIFNVTQIGKDAAEAEALTSGRIGAVIKGLIALGVPERDIFVDMVSQVPQYEMEVTRKVFSKNYNEVPAGIELQKNIHVRYRDGKLLDKIVALAAQQEIYDLVKVEYFVHNTSAVYEELRKAAFDNLALKLQHHKALGVRLDSALVASSEDVAVEYPSAAYDAYQGYGSSSVEVAKKQTGLTQVRKPSTLFFNHLSYDDFDIVLNPSFVEPPVQFTYHLVVRYQLPPAKPVEKVVTKREVIVVTPNGTTMPIKIE
jgi:uncharacterized protein YggE